MYTVQRKPAEAEFYQIKKCRSTSPDTQCKPRHATLLECNHHFPFLMPNFFPVFIQRRAHMLFVSSCVCMCKTHPHKYPLNWHTFYINTFSTIDVNVHWIESSQRKWCAHCSYAPQKFWELKSCQVVGCRGEFSERFANCRVSRQKVLRCNWWL